MNYQSIAETDLTNEATMTESSRSVKQSTSRSVKQSTGVNDELWQQETYAYPTYQNIK
jgi:hypothetical protein